MLLPVKRLLIDILTENRGNFHPVVPYKPGVDKITRFDLSETNKELTEEIYCDTGLFSIWINEQLNKEAALYATGGYNENRKIYKRSKVFDGNAKEEPRRLHLGIDIWGKCNTHVMAPLDGVVHSFAFNNNFGDYGATVILLHQLDGTAFYTLYGHVSLKDISESIGISGVVK